MDGLKKLIRGFARCRFGLFLREKFNIYPPAISLRYSEVSSDLFIWRDPALWDTYFNIVHLGPILNPDYQNSYKVVIEFYDAKGAILCHSDLDLKYGESKLYDIYVLSDKKIKLGENGTFAIFHLANATALFGNAKICIAERGFVSYKKKSDQSLLRSYAHGNANAVAYSRITNKSRCLGVLQKQKHYFRHQLNLNDAISVELIIVNFLDVDTKVSVYQYKNNTRKYLMDAIIHSRGLALLKSGIDFDADGMIEFESKINFLRPVIFKNYENHFDVLHG